MGVKQLGDEIRKAREAVIVGGKPLSQDAVAAEIGISQSAVTKYEAGQVGVPNPAVLKKMADLLDGDLLRWYSIWLEITWPGGARVSPTVEEAEQLAAEIRELLARYRAGGSGAEGGRRTGNG